MPEESKSMEIEAAFQRTLEDGTSASATLVSIQLLVVNQSRLDVKAGGKWGVKDENPNPPVVREAEFGRIPAGGSQERFVSLPSGVEWGIYRFEAENNGGSWASIHGGNNTEAYKLTLLDSSE